MLFDAYGSYQVAFIGLAGAVLLALVIGTQIKSEVDESALRA